MTKSKVFFICFFAFFLLSSLCFCQEDNTQYSNESFRRYFTSKKDDKVFMPRYKDFQVSAEKSGISLEEWESRLLSRARFFDLDKDSNGAITPDELSQDPLQGEVEEYTESADLVDKFCSGIPKYKEKIKELQKMGVSFVPGKYLFDKGKPISLENLCSMECQLPATRVYLQVEKGIAEEKKVCLGHYAFLHLEKYQSDSSFTAYILAAIILGLVAATTALVPSFMREQARKKIS